MKLTLYAKQAWQEAKAHPLYTALYVVGVTLAIALTMIFTTYYYIRIAPIYPETNRSKTYYLTSVGLLHKTEGYANRWWIGQNFADEVIYKLQNVEAATVCPSGTSAEIASIPGEESLKKEIAVNYADAGVFKVFNFDFLAGRPFSKEEYDSKVAVAVITDRVAQSFFGDNYEDAIGKIIKLQSEYTVCGVVKTGSQLCSLSYADIYCPRKRLQSMNPNGIIGGGQAVLVVKDDAQYKAMKEELDKLCEQMMAPIADEWELDLGEQPKSHFRFVMQGLTIDDADFSWWNIARKNMLIIFVLLLVPALNLSGMISGNMDGRQAEIGIRKSFGAKKSSLLAQIFTENLLYTLAGSLLGMIMSWLILYFGMKEIILMMDPFMTYFFKDFDPQVTASMLFSPTIFLIASGIILIFNTLSAVIPAWWSLRHNIVESLNNNR